MSKSRKMMIRYKNIISEEITPDEINRVMCLDGPTNIKAYFKAVYNVKFMNRKHNKLYDFSQDVPWLMKAMREDLKKEYGPLVTCYRGLRFSKTNKTKYVKKLSTLREGDEIELKSWGGRQVFEWSTQERTGYFFARTTHDYHAFGLVLKADIPVEQIIYAATSFDDSETKIAIGVTFDSHTYEEGVFVIHNKPVVAQVIYYRKAQRHD